MSAFKDRSLRLAIKLVDAYVEHLHHKNKLLELEIALKKAEKEYAEKKLKRYNDCFKKDPYYTNLNSTANKISNSID